jgi:hypothetical protein
VTVDVVTREEWGARPPKSRTPIKASKPGLAIHWEGPRMGSFPHAECADKVRGIQRFHMDSRGWADIAYSFVVCPHGSVFRGRGWNLRTAANGTDTGNDTHLAACYLGGKGDPFTAAAKRAFVWLVEQLTERNGEKPSVKPHSHFKATECPGDTIRGWLSRMMPIKAKPDPDPPPRPDPTPDPVPPPWPLDYATLADAVWKHPTGKRVLALLAKIDKGE